MKQRHKCIAVNAIGCGFDSYLRKLSEAKRGVEFRHSTKCLQNLKESEERRVLILVVVPFAYSFACRIQREV